MDVVDKEIKGEITGVGREGKVNVLLTPKDKSAFDITDSTGKDFHFIDLLGSATIWRDLIGGAESEKITAFDLMWGSRAVLSSANLLQAYVHKRP